MLFSLSNVKKLFWHKVRQKHQRFKYYCGDYGYMEPVYQHLFLRELNRCGLQDVYTPIQGAANYSLLYVVLVTILAVAPANVLELGSGQTTLLMNALREASLWLGNLVSLEHDAGWCAKIAAQVKTALIYAPLQPRMISKVAVDGYSTSDLPDGSPRSDVILIDGPPGTPRWSRLGCLAFIPDRLADDFVIVLDDYDRVGEKETAEEIRKALHNKGIVFWEECIQSNKCQLVIATEKYRGCLYPSWQAQAVTQLRAAHAWSDRRVS